MILRERDYGVAERVVAWQREGMTDGFTLTRTIEGSPAEVYAAWTRPDRLGWFSTELSPPEERPAVDARPGGVWRQRMVESADREYVTGGVYRELVPDERLVFTWGAEGGWPALEDGPAVTVALDGPETAGPTELTLRLDVPDGTDPSVWIGDACRGGWGATLDRLVAAFAERPLP